MSVGVGVGEDDLSVRVSLAETRDIRNGKLAAVGCFYRSFGIVVELFDAHDSFVRTACLNVECEMEDCKAQPGRVDIRQTANPKIRVGMERRLIGDEIFGCLMKTLDYSFTSRLVVA